MKTKGFTGHHHSEETKKRISESQKGHKGNSTSFKKGHTSWNKGKKMSEETKEKLRPTMFQKGHKNWNEVPIGTERETKDGYIEIKVASVSNVSKSVNWRPKHLWLYEQHHGVKVNTKTHCVVFLDQDKRNFNIDNLFLISRAVNRIASAHGAFVKGNAELTKTRLLLCMLKHEELNRGEDIGVVVNYSYFRVKRTYANEKAKEYRYKQRKIKNDL